MTAVPQDEVADLSRLVAELEQRLEASFVVYDDAIARQAALAEESTRLQSENARLSRETLEAFERQNATAEILELIASSPSDVQPIFDAIVKSAAKLFGPCGATIPTLKAGKLYWNATGTSLPGFDFERARAVYPIPFDPDRAPSARAILERRIIEIPDVDASDIPIYTRQAASAGGFQSITFVPLVSQHQGIGTIILSHPQVGFRLSDNQLALVQTFADQAVIAIENARLFNETQEALARQTATSDILRVISQSPTDVLPVFEAIVQSSMQLLGCDLAAVLRCDGGTFSPVAEATRDGPTANVTARNVPIDPDANFPSRAMAGKKMLHIPDYSQIELPPHEREIQRIIGVQASLFLPLLRDNECIGVLAVIDRRPRTYSESEIALGQSFCDQALIAIENVRLFNETREALERQTATADILKVIASSPSDVQPVFDAIAASANRLIAGFSTTVFRFIDGTMHLKAFTHTSAAGDEMLQSMFPRPLAGFPIFELVSGGETAQFADTEAEGVPAEMRDLSRSRGFRSMLFTPLMSNGASIGMIGITRPEPGAFADRHVQLLQTFADQAVIAIENVRLFDEVQARTADLSEALQQQTATADVLKVISRSTFDLQTVLETLIKSAVDLSGAYRGSIFLREGDVFPLKAASSTTPEFLQYWAAHPPRAGRGSATERVIASGKVEEIPDVRTDPEMQMTSGALVNIRATLGVPMLRDNKVEGVLVLTRPEPGHFSKSQIDLVQTFADQAVIAVENVRLFDETQARTRELAASLEELRTAQDRLVQTEKLASLGQLTAGIAHEIKNPLNFVNNFSSLSAELTDELNDVLKTVDLADKVRSEVEELTGLLKDNLQKVVQHGQRADSIVKNMLLHSREGSGDHRPADINALLDESRNLAYHGARAEKPQFNVTLQRDFDPNAGSATVFPQEITRVLLNLIGNGFYAVAKRKADGAEGFDPVVRATTKDLGDRVEIRIRDNGTGIPPDVKEKMFNPFFTTKPAGEGTGLGLSMSHDIIVKQHGGTIDVDTEPGAFTEFTVRLPRTGHIANKK